jgi:two-component system sensor kinase FixL
MHATPELPSQLGDDSERAMAETLRRAEERIRQQDAELEHALRLTTIGEMLAQISHEVNQPLNAIANFTHACLQELAKANGGDREQLRDWLERIGQSTSRASEVVRRISTFVRRGRTDLQDIRLDILIASSIEMAGWRASRQGIDMRFEPRDSDSHVYVDPVQMEQVFVNLLINACDAVEGTRKGSGRIVVRTSLAADAVEIIVEDNGGGIPAEVRPSIFNPFITTKPAGLGLGLAICRSIVEGHRGRIWSSDNPQGGTRFHVQLPLAAATAKGRDS